MSPDSATPTVELHDISVVFGSLTALQNVTVTFRPGERHAVIGENGAGKSTLMRVLFGLQQPGHGQVRLNGAPLLLSSPASAMAQGIGMVQQHYELVGAFTVAENILLGAETAASTGFSFDRRKANQIVTDLAEKAGLTVDPNARVRDLSVAAQQRVEILKALYRRARLLILDEPTAVLSPTEATDLWNTVDRLSKSGVTVVFVTHKLEDVMRNADTITVLRRGKHILSAAVHQTSATALAQAMVGDSRYETMATATMASHTVRTGEPLLQVSGLVVQDEEKVVRVQDATFSLHSGEILGIAGVDGSGQTELLESLIGLRRSRSGNIVLDGVDLTQSSVAARRTKGIAYIPADRHRQAVALPLTCEENIILGEQRRPAFSYPTGILKIGAMHTRLRERIATFDIRGAEIGVPLRALSGGNQQKLVLARELSRKPRLLIAGQPTRGLDFAATAFVHDRLRAERERGCAILLQSLDLEELLSLCDTIAIMRANRIVALLPRSEASLESIGAWMTGSREIASP